MRPILFSSVCYFCYFLLAGAAQSEDIVPRTVIALYNGGDVQSSYIHTLIEMPLNHLGLVVEYHDIHKPLPPIATRKDVRGVLTWFMTVPDLDMDPYVQWGLDSVEAGKKFVIIGLPKTTPQNRSAQASRQYTKLLEKVGIRKSERWVNHAFSATYTYKTPKLFFDTDAAQWLRPSYAVVHATGEQSQAHLMVRDGSNANSDSDLVVSSPNGGYVADDYIVRFSSSPSENEVALWAINPFEYFRLAFATDDLPKPDTTTAAGRRIYYSNIDGDGWNNITQIDDYRDKQILSAQVILDKAVKPYPGLPVTLSLIAADVDPDWVATKDSRRVAQDFLAQPNVEAGSHTYSHPFYWQFFASGNRSNELPYLHLYETATWQPAADDKKEDANKTDTNAPIKLPEGYKTPRAYAHEPFNLQKEITGSIDEVSALLPKGKKVEVMAWSGDCSPWEEAIRMTREAHVQNINGGDSRFDPEYPAYASEAPIGRQVGQERQIYISTSNENTYTDLWSDNYNAFEYLKKTLRNSDTPIRIKPLSIYYHIFSGEKDASLKALLSDLDYAQSQNIIPITVSSYTHIAEDFYSTVIERLAPDLWRVDKRGALQTIRFDHNSLQSVDFTQSKGVIGERHLQGSLYVYLDAAVDQPIIAVKSSDEFYKSPEEGVPYLIESRWLVSGVSVNGNNLEFSARGFGNGEMIWKMPRSGKYKVLVDGQPQDAATDEDRRLSLKLAPSTGQSRHISIRGV